MTCIFQGSKEYILPISRVKIPTQKMVRRFKKGNKKNDFKSPRNKRMINYLKTQSTNNIEEHMHTHLCRTTLFRVISGQDEL